MTNERGVDEFLRVEQEVNSLLDELNRLRQETESYATARSAMEEVVAALKPLAQQLSATAEGVTNASVTLREIGTPELMEGLNRSGEQLSAIRSDLERRTNELTSGMNAFAASLDSMRELQTREIAPRISDLSTQVSSVESSIATKLSDLKVATDAALEESDAVSDSIERLRSMTLIWFGVISVGLVTVGALVIALAN